MAAINLQFRIATPDDADRIQHLVQSAFRTVDSRQDWTGHAELASNFRIEADEVLANITCPGIVNLVAMVDNNNDGGIMASIQVSKRGTNIGRLSMIAVDDRYQRNGVGRQVLAYAEDYCRRTWCVEKFSLNALSTRKALIEWYMRRGYQKTGETSPFPREKFSNIALPVDICFVELEKDFREAPGVEKSA